jgi:hypothetical protein
MSGPGNTGALLEDELDDIYSEDGQSEEDDEEEEDSDDDDEDDG